MEDSSKQPNSTFQIPPSTLHLVVIVGPTASGKTALGIEIAEKYNGEIICADSRTVYKGMTVGTAKPSLAEQARVVHHGLDVVSPDERFTAADFKQLATTAIADIAARGKLPIVVGGSGMYIDALLFDYEFNQTPSQSLREKLSKMSVVELQKEVLSLGLSLPENSKNPRHLSRLIETRGNIARKKSIRKNTLVLGLSLDREVLKQRIISRIDMMMDRGLLEEVQQLVDDYPGIPEALQATGYKAFREYLNGSQTIEQAKDAFLRNDLKLAKRQMTWFKRNKSIQWLNNTSEYDDFVTTFLNKNQI